MRPVQKLNPNDKIVIDGKEVIVLATYQPYGDAKPVLTANIGEYCSYCECPVSNEAIHIEHIQAKGLVNISTLNLLGLIFYYLVKDAMEQITKVQKMLFYLKFTCLIYKIR